MKEKCKQILLEGVFLLSSSLHSLFFLPLYCFLRRNNKLAYIFCSFELLLCQRKVIVEIMFINISEQHTFAI